MSAQTKAGKRVVVTGRRVRRQRVARRSTRVRRVEEQTELGVVYVRSLMRAQLRLALAMGLIVLTVVGGLPLAFACFPAVSRVRVAGVPLPWLVLWLCVQPVWILVARWHMGRAERIERDFADVVTRS